MSYSVLKGKVTPSDVAPPEEKPEAEPSSGKCPHGYYLQTACWHCQPQLDTLLYADIPAYSALKVGDVVCRRIRPDERGVVSSIVYKWTDSVHMKDIWVDFCNRGRSTPYTPDELLKVKVQ